VIRNPRAEPFQTAPSKAKPDSLMMRRHYTGFDFHFCSDSLLSQVMNHHMVLHFRNQLFSIPQVIARSADAQGYNIGAACVPKKSVNQSHRI
jgi:hypothetical protein